MTLFLQRLSEGVRLSRYQTIRMARTERELVEQATADMQRAATLLHEASAIIAGLTEGGGTFGHRERALHWTQTYQQL